MAIQDKSRHIERIPPKQVKAIALLMAGYPIGDAAEEAGIAKPYLSRLLHENEAFKAAYAEEKRRLSDRLNLKTKNTLARAVDVVFRLLEDEEIEPDKRLMSAISLLAKVYPPILQRDAAIEDRIAADMTHNSALDELLAGIKDKEEGVNDD